MSSVSPEDQPQLPKFTPGNNQNKHCGFNDVMAELRESTSRARAYHLDFHLVPCATMLDCNRLPPFWVNLIISIKQI